MKEYELRYVGSHVEVYTGNGMFLFSACLLYTSDAADDA